MILDQTQQGLKTAYIDNLAQSSDYECFNHVIECELSKFGVKNWAFTLLDLPGKKQVEHQLGNTESAHMDEYMYQKLYRHDMTIEHVSKSDVPLFQSSLQKYVSDAPCYCQNTQAQEKIIKLNQSAGHDDICNVPVTSPIDGSRAMLCFSSKYFKRNSFFDYFSEQIENIQILASAIQDVGKRNFPDHFVQPVKKHGRIVYSQPLNLIFTMALYDLTIAEAAEKMDIAISTANNHLNTLRKLTNNRTNHGALLTLINSQFFTDIEPK